MVCVGAMCVWVCTTKTLDWNDLKLGIVVVSFNTVFKCDDVLKPKEAQLMLKNLLDAFRGQSRSPNTDVLGMVSANLRQGMVFLRQLMAAGF